MVVAQSLIGAQLFLQPFQRFQIGVAFCSVDRLEKFQV